MSRRFRAQLRLIASNVTRRSLRTGLLAGAVGLATGLSFLTVVLLGSLQQSLEGSFSRLGADLLVVRQGATVNLTQALLAVEPEAPPLSSAILERAAAIEGPIRINPQRAVRGSGRLALEAGLPSPTDLPLYGIDPQRDSTVIPWLESSRGIDFQDGQVILGSRRRGRLGDRLSLLGQTFRIHGRLASTGIPSHEQGLFFTLDDLERLVPSDSPATLGVNGLLVQAPQGMAIEQLRFSLLARLEDVQVVGGRTLFAMVRQAGASMATLLVLLSAILLLCFALLLTLMYAGIASERRRELGLLLSLGALPSEVLGLMVGEASLVCGGGGGLGLVVAALVGPPVHALLGDRLAASGMAFPWPALAPQAELAAGLWLLVTGIGALAAALAMLPVLRLDALVLVQGDD
ncbi:MULTISPECIES: FtsX-like permease family protein [unclassified Cyanobium]|uniref:FtsX-like permease family protein n=1 Tax=unclassified Cyanobium TaxID=2627006 RepID=UPI0020CB6D13|nr:MULTISPECIES: FtsX-like permease family protein [unclassified Cyanobium]MCP9835339.1 FtsX-like permease family protein [Cyanobium sp. La Preciosa 7G6]MCP9938143.1 FtsX-like permease family protein [Cyanobium sp. Aljojuca 7A6]